MVAEAEQKNAKIITVLTIRNSIHSINSTEDYCEG